MRLYLSSFGRGDHVPHLLRLLDGAADLTVVDHALDGASPRTADAIRQRELDGLHHLGLRPRLVDLRARDGLAALRRADAVWVTGGNVFALREALAATGAGDVLRERLTDDTLVYAGYSAGACVLAPSLRGFELVDDPTLVAEPRWDGLGVLDRPLVPHVDSPEHPESSRCDELSARLETEGVPHWRLRDGDVLVVDGDETVLLATGAHDTVSR